MHRSRKAGDTVPVLLQGKSYQHYEQSWLVTHKDRISHDPFGEPRDKPLAEGRQQNLDRLSFAPRF